MGRIYWLPRAWGDVCHKLARHHASIRFFSWTPSGRADEKADRISDNSMKKNKTTVWIEVR